jgi:hypothetical protein
VSDLTLTSVNPSLDEMQNLEDLIYEFNSRATGMADGEMLAFFERARVVARSMAGSHRWRPFRHTLNKTAEPGH